MVSKASEDFPEPERPVTTTSLSRGISTSMFLRLCSRAPLTTILSIALVTGSGSGSARGRFKFWAFMLGLGGPRGDAAVLTYHSQALAFVGRGLWAGRGGPWRAGARPDPRVMPGGPASWRTGSALGAGEGARSRGRCQISEGAPRPETRLRLPSGRERQRSERGRRVPTEAWRVLIYGGPEPAPTGNFSGGGSRVSGLRRP